MDGLIEFDEEGVVERKMLEMMQSMGMEGEDGTTCAGGRTDQELVSFDEELEVERRCAAYFG